MVKIKEEVWADVVIQARKDAPDESCGYLLGENGIITENYFMENVDHSSEHFSFDPKAQFAAVRYARAHNLQIIGNWHSHPATPSRPSQEDIRLANDPTIRYFILSLAGELPDMNAFTILHGEVIKKEPIEVL